MNAQPQTPFTSLYESQQKIHPREVTGRFANLRNTAVIALLGLFYGLPWLRWDGRQAVLFDLPARKFYIFNITFFPQDFFLLTWLLVIAALSLFFFTALAGRLWCGYACPQTVWTEAFVWLERVAEGNRNQRIKLDKQPWNFNKLWRKSLKQTLWIAFAFYTGCSFVGYFSPVRELAAGLASFSLGSWEYFWVFFYGFATYGNAGYMREQVCKYMCPYARFQSAMFDRNTLVISYDVARGEPRGSRARGLSYRSEAQGDCVDCTLCVQACPTGIDIRKGLQYECIACAACIDACDSVMDKLGSPRGLVRYSTQAQLDGNATRILRPRIVVYAAGLMLLIAGFGYAVSHRMPFNVDVLRDRNALYRTTVDGLIENVYSIRIINKDQQPHAFEIEVEGLRNVTIDTDVARPVVAAGEVQAMVIRVRVPAEQEHGGRDIKVIAHAMDHPELRVESKARFFAEP
jgi:cytochrome c oxidase accessory protein FixG